LLLDFASAVFLGFHFREPHYHILLPQILDFPSLEGQVPVLISPKKQGSPRQWVIHETVEVDFATNGQAASSSWCRAPNGEFLVSVTRF
jgi:hypothetical protein